MVALVAQADAAAALELLRSDGERATVIGEVIAGSGVQIG